MEWQPIETAPRGPQEPYGIGPRILVANNKSVGVAAWYWHKNAKTGQWKVVGRVLLFEPTHWMPMPEPPEYCGAC